MIIKQKLYISIEEPNHMCPRIDRVIETCDDVFNTVSEYQLDREDSIEIGNNMRQVEREMERLREEVMRLRDWGHAWKRKAIELHNKEI